MRKEKDRNGKRKEDRTTDKQGRELRRMKARGKQIEG